MSRRWRSWRRSSLIAVALVAALTGAGVVVLDARQPVHAEVRHSADDFNDTAVGSVPAGWSATTAGGSVAVAAMPDAVDRSLAVRKTAAAGSTLASTQFPALTGVVEVSVRVRVEQTAGWFNVLYLAGTDWTPAASIAVRDGQFNNVASGQNLLPALPGRWYRLRAVLHTGDSRFDLYVDGQRVLADAPFRARASDIARVTVGIGAGYTGTLYVDSVGRRRTPEPSVNYVALDQFNDVPVGSSPAGYELSGAGGSATVAATPSPDDRSLQLAKTSATGEGKATRVFAPQTGTVIAQANVRTDQAGGIRAALYASSSAGKPAAAIQFNNGWLAHYDGASVHRLVPATAGEWYTVRLVLDVAAQQFEIFIDGRRFSPGGQPPGGSGTGVAPRWRFRDPTATDIARLMFSTGVTSPATLRVNNVMLYQPPRSTPPGPVLDVRQPPYGAVPDGVTDNARAIQRAIDDVPAGGSVVLAGGAFLTSTIRLKSNMTLWVHHDAVLLGSPDETAYPLFDAPTNGTPSIGGQMRRALILSVGAENVSVDGGGTVDGNGAQPDWRDGSVHPPTVPGAFRPALMFLTKGRNVSVRNIHARNSGYWGVVLAENDGALVSDVNIDSNVLGMRDGVDIVDGHDTLVERVNVWSDDDAICLKSYSSKGVDGVTVRLSTVGRSERANGVKLGTASFGSFRHVVVEDVLVKHVDKGALVITAVDGSVVSDVTFRRITVDHALRLLFVLLGKRKEAASLPRWVGGVRVEASVGSRLTEPSMVSGQHLDGVTYRVYDVLISNVTQTVAGGVSRLPGPPAEYAGIYPESNYWTGNSRLPAYGYYFHHVDGLTIRGSSTTVLQPDARPPTGLRDVLSSRQ